ncbi:hypothetical protein NDU88_000524 [Pleurodeles waltl]|uniref:Uncharacterized protein n=1 Tax=Pleurodeles waltl TaxID=8319 RepID=A0AAV7S786_PLEWA|nr:hypothetical protein NDU88_000524 [Pleurodeles waltl]
MGFDTCHQLSLARPAPPADPDTNPAAPAKIIVARYHQRRGAGAHRSPKARNPIQRPGNAGPAQEVFLQHSLLGRMVGPWLRALSTGQVIITTCLDVV